MIFLAYDARYLITHRPQHSSYQGLERGASHATEPVSNSRFGTRATPTVKRLLALIPSTVRVTPLSRSYRGISTSIISRNLHPRQLPSRAGSGAASRSSMATDLISSARRWDR